MTDQEDRWLTIREASLAMNVSELTIRRRIKDGRIAHKMADGKYYVNTALPAPRPAAARVSRAEPEANADAPIEPPGKQQASGLSLETVLPELGRLAEQAGRASVLERRVAELATENESLHRDVVSLAGRNGWLESKLEEREKELRLLTDRKHKPSLWKRLLGAPALSEE